MARARWLGVLVLAVSGVVGCVPSGGRGGGGGGDGGAADGQLDAAADSQTDGLPPGPDGAPASDAELEPDVPPAAPGAPRILSLDADRRRLTEGDGMRISAVVTDEDGPEDVLGGVLEDPAGGTYGAFTATGGGTYQLDIDWAALHRTRRIEFVGEAERVLWARFFDQAGLEVVGSLRITLYCADGGACDGACRDVLGDPTNCGGCGVVCPPFGEGEATCVDGVCGGDCPAGELACDGACVDPMTDVRHCGGCGEVCPGEPDVQRCVGGGCLVCAPGESLCDEACVDLQQDVENCGRCGRGCPAPEGGEAVCVDGACDGACAGGRTLCEELCVDTAVDSEHCGDCFRSCPPRSACVDSACECPDGERACGGRCTRCPQNGVTAVACDDAACVASACAAGRVLVGGMCAPRATEQLYAVPIVDPEPGYYPPVGLDLTFRADGLPYLIVGRIGQEDVWVEAGERDREFGWRRNDFNLFDEGHTSIRVGAVALPDGRVAHGWAYGRGAPSRLLGGGLRITGPGGAQIARLPGNTGGDLWGFSTAARLVGGALFAQIGLSLDNPVNRSMSRYDWQGGALSLVDPFIDGIVHFTLDAAGEVHFVFQPDYGGDLTWRRGVAFADRVVEPVGEPAALLGGVRVGPRGPVVSYAREPDTQLRVAARVNGRWAIETVDPADVGGQFWGFDVELDPAGWPVACYWRAGAIYVARQGPGGWTRRRIAAVPDGQTECAVAIDPADGISVAWAHFVTEGGRTTVTVRYDGLAPELP